ncbi:MAG TPA: class I SAM-dependent methyltransferase [Acetobacteraceae bacterium]|nr:class I SAM-dependent methyltransferase [Acetobacteraceae bacterium]
MESKLRRYIRHGMFRVPGWLHPVDASAYAAVLLYQPAQQLSGGLAEIGVYFGRSFFLMGQALSAGEKALAADLFESGPVADGASLQLRRFRSDAERFGIPFELHIGPSERLTAHDILDAVGPVRFFSIDGGHMIEHIRNDVALATAVLAPHGIIAFDDFCSPEWPETMVGVVDFLRGANGAYVPFAITQSKLYVCRTEFHTRYMAMLSGSHWMRRYRQREITFFGSPLVWYHHPIANRIAHHAVARAVSVLPW